MKLNVTSIARRPLAAALFLALAVPGTSFAESPKEKELEARVAQLEAEVKALLNAQKQQQMQIEDTRSQVADTKSDVATAKNEVADTQAKLDKVEKSPKSAFTTGPGLSVAFHGFINANAFDQNKSFTFGNGANAEYPVAGSVGDLSGVDIRNTRFWLDITGAKLGENWTGGGRIEMDFFGGFNGTGAYSLSQPVPRLRQAYLDMGNAGSGTNVRIGQQWDLMFPIDMVPDSLTHVAFPLGFGSGLIGWRYPGVVVSQNLSDGSGPKWRLDVAALEGSWNNQGTAVNHLTDGNAGFRPQLEARLHVDGSDWSAFAAAHYANIDLKGVAGTDTVPIKSSLDSTAFEVGASVRPGPFSFKGAVYSGSGIGTLFGDISQFGDISEVGGYFQAGYHLTKNWAINALYAEAKPDKGDVITWLGHGATGAVMSQQTALNLIYSDGPYKIGIEAMRDKLDVTNASGVVKPTTGNQVSLSGQYSF